MSRKIRSDARYLDEGHAVQALVDEGLTVGQAAARLGIPMPIASRSRSKFLVWWELQAVDDLRARLADADERCGRAVAVARLEGAQAAHGEVLARLEALTGAVERLVAQAPRLVEWHPDHRRIADGGSHVRKQRRAAAGAGR